MIDIQPLHPRDFADWEPLWQDYLEFYKARLDNDVTQTSFHRLTSASEPMGGLLARNEAGEAIGLVHWVVHRSTWSKDDSCYLHDLFAVQSSRNSGVGRALIEAVCVHARTFGCRKVYWLTHESNDTAMKLYDRLAEKTGFVHYEKSL